LKDGSTLHLQDLIAFGGVKDPFDLNFRDYERGEAICAWARNSNIQIDGLVRLETGFELILCDSGSGKVKLKNTADATDPTFEGIWSDPRLPERFWENRRRSDDIGEVTFRGRYHPIRRKIGWFFAKSASRHNLDMETKFFIFEEFISTLYNSKYASLKELGAYNDNRKHNLEKIGKTDLDAWLNDLQSTLREWDQWLGQEELIVNRIGWRNIAKIIEQSFGSSLLEMKKALSERDSEDDMNIIEELQSIAFQPLIPFIDFHPVLNSSTTPFARWDSLTRANEACILSRTGHLDPKSFTSGEIQLKNSIETVMSTLCKFFASTLGVSMDFTEAYWMEKPIQLEFGGIFNDFISQIPFFNESSLPSSLLSRISDELDEIIKYLSWPIFTAKCDRICEDDEICYVPMWLIDLSISSLDDLPSLTPSCKHRDEFLRFI
jgi:hypothetical protein